MGKGDKEFPEFILEGLERTSISLRNLCRQSRTDPSFLSKVLRRRLPPPTDEKLLKRLADVLGLDPLTLIISTGMIPTELRRDPVTIKRLLEGGRAEPQKKSHSVPLYRPSHLTEDLL